MPRFMLIALLLGLAVLVGTAPPALAKFPDEECDACKDLARERNGATLQRTELIVQESPIQRQMAALEAVIQGAGGKATAAQMAELKQLHSQGQALDAKIAAIDKKIEELNAAIVACNFNKCRPATIPGDKPTTGGGFGGPLPPGGNGGSLPPGGTGGGSGGAPPPGGAVAHADCPECERVARVLAADEADLERKQNAAYDLYFKLIRAQDLAMDLAARKDARPADIQNAKKATDATEKEYYKASARVKAMEPVVAKDKAALSACNAKCKKAAVGGETEKLVSPGPTAKPEAPKAELPVTGKKPVETPGPGPAVKPKPLRPYEANPNAEGGNVLQPGARIGVPGAAPVGPEPTPNPAGVKLRKPGDQPAPLHLQTPGSEGAPPNPGAVRLHPTPTAPTPKLAPVAGGQPERPVMRLPTPETSRPTPPKLQMEKPKPAPISPKIDEKAKAKEAAGAQ